MTPSVEEGRQPSHRVDVSGLVGWAVGHAKSKQKCESRTNLVQDLHKTVPRARRSKIRPAPVTTEGDKMKVSASVKAPQRIAHKRKKQTAEKSKTAPLNTKVCGTRRVPTKGSTRMIYSFSVSTKNIVKKSLRHPPRRRSQPRPHSRSCSGGIDLGARQREKAADARLSARASGRTAPRDTLAASRYFCRHETRFLPYAGRPGSV